MSNHHENNITRFLAHIEAAGLDFALLKTLISIQKHEGTYPLALEELADTPRQTLERHINHLSGVKFLPSTTSVLSSQERVFVTPRTGQKREPIYLTSQGKALLRTLSGMGVSGMPAAQKSAQPEQSTQPEKNTEAKLAQLSMWDTLALPGGEHRYTTKVPGGYMYESRKLGNRTCVFVADTP